MPKTASLDEFWNDVKQGVYNFTKEEIKAIINMRSIF